MPTATYPYLADLAALPWVEAAFLMLDEGTVIDRAGHSEALRDSSRPLGAAVGRDAEPTTSLYLTSVTETVFLGVLYSRDVEVEDVRAQVSLRHAGISQALRAR